MNWPTLVISFAIVQITPSRTPEHLLAEIAIALCRSARSVRKSHVDACRWAHGAGPAICILPTKSSRARPTRWMYPSSFLNQEVGRMSVFKIYIGLDQTPFLLVNQLNCYVAKYVFRGIRLPPTPRSFTFPHSTEIVSRSQTS